MALNLPSWTAPASAASLVAIVAGGLLGAGRLAPADEPATGAVYAAEPGESDRAISFNRDVRPILSNNCFACHGTDEQTRAAGLRLDLRDHATRDRGAGAAIVPGSPESSELLRRVRAANPGTVMPPPELNKRLTPEQIETLRLWIQQGAEYERHWSFVAPTPPPAPRVADDAWTRDPLDRFVRAKQHAHGATPSPEADKPTLARRAALVITGLPPEPALRDAYLEDDAPDAYERYVDALLASPAYGEHWAVPWLDQVRYADTMGYEADPHRDAWPYRDWVVNALNDDMPFDRFTIEQLAGDLLPEPTRDQRIATAMNRLTMTNTEGGTDDEEFRTAAVIDRVNTTMQVFNGLTAACAQCHSHKYDPLTHKEYFGLAAFFNNTADADTRDDAPVLRVGTPDAQRDLDRLRSLVDQATAELRAATAAATETNGTRPEPVDEPLWIDDRAPVLSNPVQYESPGWRWVQERQRGAPTPASGTRSLEVRGDGLHQAFVEQTPFAVTVREDDAVLVRVYADPADPPDMVMIQVFSERSRWEHRAYFGADRSPWGTPETGSRRHLGAVPTAGGWVTLRLPITQIDLQQGDLVRGIAFTVSSGRAWFDGATLEHTTAEDLAHRASAQAFSERAARARAQQHTLHGLGPEAAAALDEPVAERTPQQRAAIENAFTRHASDRVFRATLAPRTSLAAAEQQLQELDATLARLPVMQELPAEQHRETHVLLGGSFLSPAERVEPHTPAWLHAFPTDAPPNRLGLARWLASPENPLTARVAVNRVWMEIFGRGLVTTPEDFGFQGAMPTNQPLLDHLATSFQNDGWSQKRLIRRIVTSATFRQQSGFDPARHADDPQNDLLTRGPRYRLRAETIRDQALAVAGLLSSKRGGPSVFPPQPEGVWNPVYSNARWETSQGEDRYRRGLYTYHRRTSPYPAFTTLDAGAREVCMPRRITTNTPLQAMVLLNDPAYTEAAQAFARRALRHQATLPEPDDAPIAAWLIENALLREPTAEETRLLAAFIAQQRAAFAAEPHRALVYATTPLGPLLEGTDPAEAAALTAAASIVLNLDEFLTLN